MKKLLGLVGLIVIGGIFSIYLFRNAKQPERTKESLEVTTVMGLKKELKSNSQIRRTIYVDWINNDGVSVPLKSEQFVLLSKDFGIKDSDISQIDGSFLDPIEKKVTKFYQKMGFSLNEENTSLSGNQLWSMILGFEKNGVYCVNKFSIESDPFGYLSCGVVDENQIKLQKELESVMEQSMNDIGNSVPPVFRVEKVSGNFARGSVSGIAGWTFFAKKTDNMWKVVWKSNEIVPCLEIEKLEIPKSIYGNCYSPK